MGRVRGWLGGTALLALGLNGCGQPQAATNSADSNAAAPLPPLPAAVPMTTGPATPAAVAPSGSALPGRPARLARLGNPSEGYAWLDRAYGQAAAEEDAPPDYGFDYEGVEPWTWDAADGSREIVEPVPDGYRYYYYQPDEDTPYLVRDPDYSYAYDGPSLVAVYGRGGRLLPIVAGVGVALLAGRYVARAQSLYGASVNRPRLGVAAGNWAARSAAVSAARAQWSADRAQSAAWSAWHAEHGAEVDAHWSGEQAARARAAQRFAGWRADGFQGSPPTLYARSNGAAARPNEVSRPAPGRDHGALPQGAFVPQRGPAPVAAHAAPAFVPREEPARQAAIRPPQQARPGHDAGRFAGAPEAGQPATVAERAPHGSADHPVFRGRDAEPGRRGAVLARPDGPHAPIERATTPHAERAPTPHAERAPTPHEERAAPPAERFDRREPTPHAAAPASRAEHQAPPAERFQRSEPPPRAFSPAPARQEHAAPPAHAAAAPHAAPPGHEAGREHR